MKIMQIRSAKIRNHIFQFRKTSSHPSMQSRSPSQSQTFGKHASFDSHWNFDDGQLFSGQSTSSLPEGQSNRLSHLCQKNSIKFKFNLSEKVHD